jgi:hypothetical protein
MPETDGHNRPGSSENITQTGETEPTGPVSLAEPKHVEIALACLATAAHILEAICKKDPRVLAERGGAALRNHTRYALYARFRVLSEKKVSGKTGRKTKVTKK